MSLGSVWRKWDLHIHTPESLVHSYPGPDPWDSFLTDLNDLPPEVSVVGINDYLFVDGYERVIKEFNLGNLPKLEAVFPVLEFRLKELVGSEGHLSRINLHIIFSEGEDPDSIRAQFINGLTAGFRLAAEHENVTWAGFPSRQNLADLGASIRSSVPKDKLHEFSESDLELGFNNLVVDVSEVRKLLDAPLWKDSHLLGVGKTEWASIKWSPASIAIKKDVINGSNLVFVASETPAAYVAARESLRTAEVNSRLLDCSDAHSLSTSNDKDRLGNCFTWINADPTIKGLAHALEEFDYRVHVGVEPSKLSLVRQRPSYYIDSVSVRKTATASGEPHGYFDITLALNPGFVAVIGNKGKGKSALLDVIGLLGNSSNESEFTFLSRDRFRNALANFARSYEGKMVWRSGEVAARRLDDHVPAGSVEHLSYLPQQLIDSICDPDPGLPAERFSRELGNVLFAHVPIADRLGTTDLDSLISRRTSAIETRVAGLRTDLSLINRELAELERKLRPSRRATLENELEDLRIKVAELERQAPLEPKEPVVDDEATKGIRSQINELENREANLNQERVDLEQELGQVASSIDAATQLITSIETLQQQLLTFMSHNEKRAAVLGLSLEDLVKLDVRTEPVRLALKVSTDRKDEIESKLKAEAEGSVLALLRQIADEKEEATSRLNLPARQYEAAKKEFLLWQEARKDLLVGTAEARGIKQVERALLEIQEIPIAVDELSERRRQKVLEIHSALLEVVSIYTDLYKPARQFIDSHPLADKAQLQFGATLREKNLEEKLWSLVGRNTVGTFLGVEESSAYVRTRIERADFGDADSVIEFCDEMNRALHFDLRSEGAPRVDPEKSLRSGHSIEEVYDLVFGLNYLEPYYMLRYSGVSIDRLSPGEKGTLLLMFYLLVDPSDRPLLLDQPDENLDNQTIKELLVPALKEAKERRQVVVVTHNPNVAVVADADQVIVADFDGNRFLYTAGAIEDPAINEMVVNVLEGTWPAFQNREFKYQPPI